MSQIFRLPSSSMFTCYLPSCKYYDGTYLCSKCLKKPVLQKKIRYSTHEAAPNKSVLNNRKRINTRENKNRRTELVKVTNTETTQKNMTIGKLNASDVTAFVEKPGMILQSLRPSKQTTVHEENSWYRQKRKNNRAQKELTENSKKNLKSNWADKYLTKFPISKENSKTEKNKKIDDIIKTQFQIQEILGHNPEGKPITLRDFEELAIQKFNKRSVPQEEIGRKFEESDNYENNEKFPSTMTSFMKKELVEMAKMMEETLSNCENDLMTYFQIKEANFDNPDDYNKLILSYVDVCVHTGLLENAHKILKGSLSKKITYPSVYNIVIRGFVHERNWDVVQDLVNQMEKNNVPLTCQTYAHYLDCLSRVSDKHKYEKIYAVLSKLLLEGHRVMDLFTKTRLNIHEKDNVLGAIRNIMAEFEIDPHSVNLNSNCHLVADLYQGQQNTTSPLPYFTHEQIHKAVEEQLSLEKKVVCKIESIVAPKNHSSKYEELWSELFEIWTKNIKKLFLKQLQVLELESTRKISSPVLYPYLRILSTEEYVDVMLQEILSLCRSSPYHTCSTYILYNTIGDKIWFRYISKKKIKHEEDLRKTEKIIKTYCSWYLKAFGPAHNSRQKWQMLMWDNPDNSLANDHCVHWPDSIKSALGKFLYNIILQVTMIPSHVLTYSSKKNIVPAFYLVLRHKNGTLTEEVVFHPALISLYKNANINTLHFDTDKLPMFCPPKPWTSIDNGGYYILPTDFLRKTQFNFCMREVRKSRVRDLYAVFDSLNQLQSVPWTINEKVLDVALQVFRSGGSQELNVPIYPDRTPIPEPCNIVNSNERLRAFQERMKIMQKRHEDYGLWCEALYKLSLANYYRKKIFWLPYNMDFRGRVYPVPPHVSHLSSDLYRSFLLFAKKEVLGEKGLDWLKIHAINLTGTHKKKSVEERLMYADQMLPEILDSAENPLNGKKWWMKSEEPWQTLAACIEISNAVKSGDPKNYRSGFPVHQDGSCNGLQHYAALGRDSIGAASVNLAPSPLPADVYSAVVSIIEKMRIKDAENGLLIAQVLEGHVNRKVIKQTIMTTVYGVTLYGARSQIGGRLEDKADFPHEKVEEAAFYLSRKVFEALKEMFCSAREIQEWFLECGEAICRHHKASISWVTPLGLPVVQPYFKNKKYKPKLLIPDIRKQKNAFPPNFIHSLDSAHMMLTALYCGKAGLTFASIHDCFWTHPSSIEKMNWICRKKFIELHSEDILINLSKHFQRLYLSDQSHNVHTSVIKQIPSTGDFNLNQVMDSVYFFS